MAFGHDLINPRILNVLQAEFLLTLVDILNQSLLDGRLPQVWKQANVCSILKKDDRGDPAIAYICKFLKVYVMLSMTTYKPTTYCVMSSLDLGLVADVIRSCYEP